jgi:hypothetical protein
MKPAPGTALKLLAELGKLLLRVQSAALFEGFPGRTLQQTDASLPQAP